MQPLSEIVARVETKRFGPFTLQVGVDWHTLDMLHQRVADAHSRFISSPLANVANALEKEVIVSSVFGTNTIEGGTLTREETERALTAGAENLQAVQRTRVVNIRRAYDLARQNAEIPGWRLNDDFIRQLHRVITTDIPDAHNVPGEFRNNSDYDVTYVGDESHGGRYKPPQLYADIVQLTARLVGWQNDLFSDGVSALIRAPLLHLYFELIHPFRDGNGRVGRVLEATILHAEGFRYAPFALANYYLEHIDEYFTLFNGCRKRADEGDPAPNTAFVRFHLEGMLIVINRLHDRVNHLVVVLLFENQVKRMYEQGEINARQYTIVAQLIGTGKPMPIDEMRTAPWYQTLYLALTDKTKQRDFRRLRELNLIRTDRENRIRPAFAKSDGAAS